MAYELDDDVYGHFTIDEAILVDLLQSRGVQRLRGISQAGAASLIRPGRSNTRYEHSIGVMLLTRILGGSETEQAAGLIQDASHTVFSHTVDHVYDDRKEEFHERIFPMVMEQGDIPAVLGQHGITWRRLLSQQNMGRVDAPAPLLCADRIDYALRDLLRFGHIATAEARDFVDHLVYVDGVVAVRDLDQAIRFAEWYRHLILNLYMHPVELYADDELAGILREALHRGILAPEDMLLTDIDVLGKLRADTIYGLDCRLAALEATSVVIEASGPGSRRVFSKPRVVDPPILIRGATAPLSVVAPSRSLDWSSVRTRATGGVCIRALR